MKTLFHELFSILSAICILIAISVFASASFSQQTNSTGFPDKLTQEQIQNFKDENGKRIFQSDDTTDAFQNRNFTGFNTGDDYGISVSSAGDVNGDGYDDIVIGAPYNDGPASNAGRAYIYFGGLSINILSDVVLSAESAQNYFGYSVSSAGDVNADGYDDVIIGAYAYPNGRAYVYLGGSVMNNIADVTFTGDSVGNQFGYSVSKAGDVNGDGFCDVIVGAPSYGSERRGRAYIYYGGTSMNNSADVILTGEVIHSSFGYSVSDGGDVNGDGYDDVICGAYEYSLMTGRAYLYYGGSSMNNVADLTFTGSTDSFFSISVSSAGDINSDGYYDVIIGVPGYSANTGKAAIYFGGANMNNTEDVSLTGPVTASQFGICVSSAGDVNGDGFDDIIVGADSYSGFTGRAALYYGGSAMDNVADFVATGEANNNSFGSSVSSAGDVNGDGYADMIIGAYQFSSYRGKAYLYMFGMSGNFYSNLSFNGEASNNYLGYSVSSAGDVNGDGYADIIIGAYGYSSNTGRAYIFYGGSVMNNVADVTFTGSAGNYFGWSVASAGDVNADGYSDVIIGAYAYDTYSGKAEIYLGGASMDNSVDVLLIGPGINYYFGYSVASAGDVNGDGYSDVIVGASEYSSATGRAYIYYGGSSMNNTVDITLQGETSSNNFGACVSSAGDVNGDGFSDVIVGAYSYSTSMGRAYVFYGGASMNNTSDVTMTGEASSTRFGYSVSSAGDVNGDGYSDIIVGAPFYSSFTGRAYIFYGGLSMNNIYDVVMTGEEVSNYFGISVSSAGDMNKDGYSDAVVGAYSFNNNTGRAYLFFGGNSMNNNADVTMTGETTTNYFGISVASAGDVNGDGGSDLIVGASYYNTNTGRSYLYLNTSPDVHPNVLSVKDVQGDQGGYVNVKWARSAYDLNLNGLVTNYVIERGEVSDISHFNWVVVGTVPAVHNTVYNYEARTAFDSGSTGNAIFSFRVTAYTNYPGESWRSNTLSGYSIDNLAPLAPLNLSAVLILNKAQLTWNANHETDLRQYIIYRDGIQIGTSLTLSFIDSTIFPDSTYAYKISAEDVHGNIGPKSDSAMLTYIVSTLDIRVIQEGLYNGITKKLNLRDTVKTFLHSSSSPYNEVDSAVSVIDSVSFSGSFRFFNAPNGSYYIVLEHRNTIETWSKSGGETFTSGTLMNYDFTSALSQAFGNNMTQIDNSPLRYAIYSGDVNKDGTVDLTDIVNVFNDANAFLSGYVATDITGDNFVDLSDLTLTFNNANAFVSVVRP